MKRKKVQWRTGSKDWGSINKVQHIIRMWLEMIWKGMRWSVWNSEKEVRSGKLMALDGVCIDRGENVNSNSRRDKTFKKQWS